MSVKVFLCSAGFNRKAQLHVARFEAYTRLRVSLA